MGRPAPFSCPCRAPGCKGLGPWTRGGKRTPGWGRWTRQRRGCVCAGETEALNIHPGLWCAERQSHQRHGKLSGRPGATSRPWAQAWQRQVAARASRPVQSEEGRLSEPFTLLCSGRGRSGPREAGLRGPPPPPRPADREVPSTFPGPEGALPHRGTDPKSGGLLGGEEAWRVPSPDTRRRSLLLGIPQEKLGQNRKGQFGGFCGDQISGSSF